LHWCKPLSRYVEFGDEQNLDFRLLTIEQSGSMDALVVEVMSNLIEDLGEDGTLDEEIPVSEVNGAILSKIVDWCTHHWSDQAPAGNEVDQKKNTTELGEWDREFFKRSIRIRES